VRLRAGRRRYKGALRCSEGSRQLIVISVGGALSDRLRVILRETSAVQRFFCEDVRMEGGCSCGKVRYRLASAPLFVHCCHCLNCQRQTGSAFVINLLIEADRVELLAGEPQPVDVKRDDGSVQRIYRCPTCEVAVYSQYTSPAFLFVRAGTLDEPREITPDVHIFTKSKVDWVVLPKAVPAFELFYDMAEQWPAASLERVEALRQPR
jgi:hypothetical protein